MLLENVLQRGTVDLAEPEENAPDVGVATEVAKVPRSYEGTIVFSINERTIIDRIHKRVDVSNAFF